MKNPRILVIAPLLLTFFTACSTSPASQPTDVPTQIPPTPTPVELSPDPVPIPEENTLYLGTSKWMPVLFMRDPNSNNPYLGIIQTGHWDHGPGHNDFRQIENPQIVFISDEEIERMDDFAFSKGSLDSLYLLLTYNVDSDFPSEEQRLIEVNLDTLESKLIWTYLVSAGDYGEYAGRVFIGQLYIGPYLLLNIFDCYGCEPTMRWGKILINPETGEEKFLGLTGDIYINYATEMVTYRKVETFLVPCDYEPVYNPNNIDYSLGCPHYGEVGDFISEELP